MLTIFGFAVPLGWESPLNDDDEGELPDGELRRELTALAAQVLATDRTQVVSKPERLILPGYDAEELVRRARDVGVQDDTLWATCVVRAVEATLAGWASDELPLDRVPLPGDLQLWLLDSERDGDPNFLAVPDLHLLLRVDGLLGGRLLAALGLVPVSKLRLVSVGP